MFRFPVTAGLILVNLVVYFLIHVGVLEVLQVVSTPHVLTIGTFLSHFSHFDLMHILMNMFVLWQVGSMLEHYLDSPKLLMIVLSIWLLAVAITFPVMDSPSLGFSAINMGLLAFSIGLFRHHKEFAKSLAGWLGLNIVIGLLPQISFWGHLGGAVSGMVVFVSLWWFGWREVR